MKILELRAENFKKLRVVEIRPDGNLVPITGKNGQGKTSVLDAIWFALKGKRALPLKPVRKGTERMKVQLTTEDFTVTRTLTAEGSTPTISLEMNKGKTRDKTPQDFLDEIIGELTFDPLDFLKMDAKAQVDMLRKTAKVDVDFEEIEVLNKKDYDDRTLVNREIATLDGQIKGVNVLDGLPKEKIDTDAIMKKLNTASEANARALEVSRKKSDMGAEASRIGSEKVRIQARIDEIAKQIEQLTDQRANLQLEAVDLEKKHKAAEKAFQQAPEGETVDVAALTQELANANRTNAAIEQRVKWEQLRNERDQKQKQADKLTHQIEARNEKKRDAIGKAKIPVEGLTFDETRVTFNGLPIENLGEGEQIRLSVQIGMAANPKLRILCIRHGEALDEDGLNIIADLAKAHDFQIWMARVDSSGKVGIVLEDGMIAGEVE